VTTLTFSPRANFNLLVLILFKEKSKECLLITVSHSTINGDSEIYLRNEIDDVGETTGPRHCAAKSW
jgi:hypothetical protein